MKIENITYHLRNLQKIIKAQEFHLHKPHPLLARQALDSKYIPAEHWLFRKVDNFLKHKILKAKCGSEPKKTLVFGPNRFEDFPLSNFLEKGVVIGLDINYSAMQEARANLSDRMKNKLLPLNIDASLFANTLIEKTQREVQKHPSLTRQALESLLKVLLETSASSALPFNDQEIDMIVSVNCANQFLGMACDCILSILDEKYQREKVNDFFLYGNNFEFFAAGLNPLARKIVQTHIKEAQRMLKPGGIFFLSDHSMKIETVNDIGSFYLQVEELNPAYSFLPNIKLQSEKETLKLNVGEEADLIKILGKDTLEEMVKGVTGFQIIDKFYFWDINYVGHAIFGIPSMYFLDTALVLKSKR